MEDFFTPVNWII